jgi:hypothetical protein
MTFVRGFLIIIMGLLFMVALYLPLIPSEFFSTDDADLTQAPYLIAPLNSVSLKKILTPGAGLDYYPVRDLTYVLDSHWGASQPTPYRIDQLVLAGLASLILFYLLIQLQVDAILAALVSVFWLLHPLHLEMIDWISARKDLLALTFTLLSTLLFVIGVKKENSKKSRAAIWYLLAVLSFSLGLLSKVSFALLPFAALVWKSPLRAKRWASLALSLGLAMAAFQSWFYSHFTDMRFNYTWPERFRGSLEGLGREVGGWFWPNWNAIDSCNWDQWLDLNQKWLPLGLAVWLALAVLALFAFKKKNQRATLFLTLWFTLYLPVSSLIFPHRNFYSTRYLEPVFVAWLIVIVVSANRVRKPSYWLALLVVAALATQNQLPNWESNVAIREHALSVTPNALALQGMLLTDIANVLHFGHSTPAEIQALKKEATGLKEHLQTVCLARQPEGLYDSCLFYWKHQAELGEPTAHLKYIEILKRAGPTEVLKRALSDDSTH